MMNKKKSKRKSLFTAIVLFVIQAFAGIPTPGVNIDYFKALLEQNTTAGLFNVLSGNGLSNLSVTMLSITPYITASIILQLLTIVTGHWKNYSGMVRLDSRLLKNTRSY